MFWKNIVGNYNSLEKRCNACRILYAKDVLVKNESYFKGTRRICPSCLELMNSIINGYMKKYGQIHSRDKLYPSNMLPRWTKDDGKWRSEDIPFADIMTCPDAQTSTEMTEATHHD